MVSQEQEKAKYCLHNYLFIDTYSYHSRSLFKRAVLEFLLALAAMAPNAESILEEQRLEKGKKI